MVTIYILRLIENKIYVGSVEESQQKEINKENLEKNILLEIKGYGAEWTRIYKPTGIYEIYYNCKREDINKYTKIMMKKYGIENVRGGIYNKVIINDIQKMVLEMEIINKNNVNPRYEIINDDEIFTCEICDREFEEERECLEHEYKCKMNTNICYKCNRRGHFVSECNQSVNKTIK